MTDTIAGLLGTWSQGLEEASILFRISTAVILAAVIGYERSSKRHSAGLRTFMCVSLSTCLSMLLDIYISTLHGTDFFLLSGVSIVAVSVISIRSLLFSSRNQIKGLTTAAALLTCGVIGLSIGAGFYTATLAAFLVLLCCLSLAPAMEVYLKNRSNHFEIHLELKSSNDLQNFVSTIRRLGMRIDDIEKNQAYSGSGLSVYSIAISISNEELKKYKTHLEIIEALSSLEYIYHIEEQM